MHPSYQIYGSLECFMVMVTMSDDISMSSPDLVHQDLHETLCGQDAPHQEDRMNKSRTTRCDEGQRDIVGLLLDYKISTKQANPGGTA